MDLKELKKLCDAAVPGPWMFESFAPDGDDPVHYSWRILTPSDSYSDILRYGYDATNHDTGRFIAMSREVLPKLLDLWQACLDRDRKHYQQDSIDDALQALEDHI